MARFIMGVAIALFAAIGSSAASAAVCTRPPSGSEVKPPPDLYSSGGVLNVTFKYITTLTLPAKQRLFCFQTPDGVQSPTLHVRPGDTIKFALINTLPAPPASEMAMSTGAKPCGAGTMTSSSVNLHFHGLNLSPRCHGDEVVHTMVNSGQRFDYDIEIPANEPPGLYWYHPHIHGTSSATVLGGASGIIEVEGIENLQPAVAGLPQRYLVIRDQLLVGDHDAHITHRTAMAHRLRATPSGRANVQPNWNLSVNFVPVLYPYYGPALIKMAQGSREFWRVANASANTILNLELQFDHKPQPLQLVAIDGVPTGSQDGKRQGSIVTHRHILIPPAGRAEFIVSAPSGQVHRARLVTRRIDTGPQGDSDPRRPLAKIVLGTPAKILPRVPERSGPPHPQRFEALAAAKVTASRKLYFSEVPIAGGGPEDVNFFITVDGQTPTLFDANNPPAIVTHKGAVEDWVIENRTQELHEFHMHQIHFLLMERNGQPVPAEQQQFYDTIQVPYWSGTGPYPSVKVRMDFRGAVVGDFVYHCHILDHEDGGMMAIIRVLPKT